MEVNNSVPGVVESSPASWLYKPGCPISMINKDLRLAMAVADDSKSPLLLAKAARDAYYIADKEYHGQDFSFIY